MQIIRLSPGNMSYIIQIIQIIQITQITQIIQIILFIQIVQIIQIRKMYALKELDHKLWESIVFPRGESCQPEDTFWPTRANPTCRIIYKYHASFRTTCVPLHVFCHKKHRSAKGRERTTQP